MTDDEYEHLKRFGVSKELHEVRRQKAELLRARKLVKEKEELQQLRKSPEQVYNEERIARIKKDSRQIAKGTTSRSGKFVKFLTMQGVKTVDTGASRFRNKGRVQGVPSQTSNGVSLGSPMGFNPSLSQGARDGTLITGNIADRDFFGQKEAKEYYGDKKHKQNLDNLI